MFKNASLLLSLVFSATALPYAQDSQPAASMPAIQASPTTQAPSRPFVPLPDGIAARAEDPDGSITEVTLAELDALLLSRHGHRPEGQDVLARLLNMVVLKQLALEKKVEISDQLIDQRIAEIDAKLVADGYEGGIAAQLIASDITPKIFRSTFAISLSIEELTRIALGLAEGERPGNGQQQAWMEETMKARDSGVNNDPFPTEGAAIVAYSGDVNVTMNAFKQHLRDELPRAFVEQSCTQLILMKRLRTTAGKIDEAEWQASVDLEIGRRRERHLTNPQTKGVTYEQLLDAQGLSLPMIAKDPAVVVTALTTIMAWRKEIEAAKQNASQETDPVALRAIGLRVLYEREKDLFDGYYGERLHLLTCILRAVEIPNEIVSRSLDEARAYLGRLAPGIPDEEGFKLIVGKLSDDVGGRESGGELGWFGRGDERLPVVIREAAFAYWDEHKEPGVAGPIDVIGGVVILWVGPHQAAPNWDRLAPSVESELQARALNAAMPKGGIHIFRDPPPVWTKSTKPASKPTSSTE